MSIVSSPGNKISGATRCYMSSKLNIKFFLPPLSLPSFLYFPFPAFPLSAFVCFFSFFYFFFTRIPFFLPFYISFSLFSSLLIPPSVIPPISLKYRKQSSGAVFHIYDFSVHQSITDFGEPPSEHSSVETLPVRAEKGRLGAESPGSILIMSFHAPQQHSACFLFLNFFFSLCFSSLHTYIFLPSKPWVCCSC